MSKTSEELAFIESEIHSLLPIIGEEDLHFQPGMLHRLNELNMRIKQFETDLIKRTYPPEREHLHADFIPYWMRITTLIDLVTGVNGDKELMTPRRLMGQILETTEWRDRMRLYTALSDITDNMWRYKYYTPYKSMEASYRIENANLFDRQVIRLKNRLTDLGVNLSLIHIALAPYREFRDHPQLPFRYIQLTKLRRMIIDIAWWIERGTDEHTDEKFIWLLGSLHLNSWRFIKYCKGWFFRQVVEQPSYKQQLDTVDRLKSFVRSFDSYDWNLYTESPSLRFELLEWLLRDQRFLEAKIRDGGELHIAFSIPVTEMSSILRATAGKKSQTPRIPSPASSG